MARFKHGYSKKIEYKSWQSMKERCFNRNSTSYSDYGGRGITVCERWLIFTNFLADMGPRPSHNYTIERNDSDGDYEPENCRWATYKEQNNNTRHNRIISVFGERMNLRQASDRFNISYDALQQRISKQGMDPELAITKPVAIGGCPNPEKRMNPDRILSAFSLHASGLTQRKIAECLGVDASVISRVLNKKGYGGVR